MNQAKTILIRTDIVCRRNVKSNGTRSKIYVNHYPERNVLPFMNRLQQKKILGEKHVDKKDGQIVILSDSITKPIDMVEFNYYLVNGHAVKPAHGGKLRHNYRTNYALASLNEDKPGTMVICAGTNNLSKRWWQTEDDIVTEIMEIVQTCRQKPSGEIICPFNYTSSEISSENRSYKRNLTVQRWYV